MQTIACGGVCVIGNHLSGCIESSPLSAQFFSFSPLRVLRHSSQELLELSLNETSIEGHSHSPLTETHTAITHALAMHPWLTSLCAHKARWGSVCRIAFCFSLGLYVVISSESCCSIHL